METIYINTEALRFAMWMVAVGLHGFGEQTPANGGEEKQIS